MSNDPKTVQYRNSLLALAILGLPLTEIPSGVSANVELQCALQELIIALLKVQIEVMKATNLDAGDASPLS